MNENNKLSLPSSNDIFDLVVYQSTIQDELDTLQLQAEIVFDENQTKQIFNQYASKQLIEKSIVHVNGYLCIIHQTDENNFVLYHVGDLVDTSQQNRIATPVVQPAIEPIHQESKQDYSVVIGLITVICVLLGLFGLISLLRPQKVLTPYKHTICRPNYVLIVPVGETCNIDEGYQ